MQAEADSRLTVGDGPGFAAVWRVAFCDVCRWRRDGRFAVVPQRLARSADDAGGTVRDTDRPTRCPDTGGSQGRRRRGAGEPAPALRRAASLRPLAGDIGP